MSTTQPVSGCGPGISRSADTPQHGVRSVRERSQAAELAFAVCVLRRRIAVFANDRVNLNEAECVELARLGQELADKAMAMQLCAVKGDR